MKTIFSGVKPTNDLHIGNYLGAIKNWVELQADYHCIYCVVDLHALTVRQDPEILRQNILKVAKAYVALGVDPARSIIFQQSDVSAHSELCWLLNTVAKMGEMERMTQFKDKSQQHPGNINVGLFDYPVLMAADILLYDTAVVPVGEDQKQHVELARNLAQRFNQQYGDVFTVPEPLIKKEGARIMGLDDPSKKMSKTAGSAANYISLLDTPDAAAKKIMRAVTDSGSEVKYSADKPALANLLTIYSLLSGQTIKNLEKQYAGQGYGDFKKDLAQVVVDFVSAFQTKFNAISDAQIRDILTAGARAAGERADRKLTQIKEIMGLK